LTFSKYGDFPDFSTEHSYEIKGRIEHYEVSSPHTGYSLDAGPEIVPRV
jgi:hypothetical protein